MKPIIIISSLFLTQVAFAQVNVSSAASRQSELVCSCLTAKNLTLEAMKEDDLLYEMRDCQTNATFQQLSDSTLDETILQDKELAQNFNETTMQKLSNNCVVVQKIAEILDDTPQPSEVSVAPYFLPKSYWKGEGFVTATTDSPNSQMWKHADDALGNPNMWRVVDYRWVFNSPSDALMYWAANESALSEDGKKIEMNVEQMDNLPQDMVIFEDNDDIKIISESMGLNEQHYCVIFTAQNILCKTHFTLAPDTPLLEIVPILEAVYLHTIKLGVKD